ncbi:MAG: beta-ketoacyl-ACP synthase [Sphingomonadales bacterium]|jgi:3-oxoacyl-[acyl-carrier-protein] synthase II
MRRVVVTGMGGVSPLGEDWATIKSHLLSLRNAIQYMADWEQFEGLNTKLACPVPDFSLPKHYTRKIRRSMSRVAEFSTRASELALFDSGLNDNTVLKSGRAGVAFGSSTGGTDAVRDFGRMFYEASTASIKANTYIQMMPHTTAFNVGSFFGMTGRIVPTSTACTSGSLAIGMAYEAIKFGQQDVMIAGGAEELCVSEATVFDTLYATSTKNDTPEKTPRPYDQTRDGLVIGEGAGALVLEEMEHAVARGAPIYAELVGFGTNSDGRHATQPTKETMGVAMELALKDANLDPDSIGYVNGHGTATDLGDVAETLATRHVFGRAVPFSSLKSYMGHTLGACGSLEAWMSIQMMREGWFAPTLNLNTIDERCGDLDYLRGGIREIETDYIMSNNFAFGGVNTSLVFKRWHEP